MSSPFRRRWKLRIRKRDNRISGTGATGRARRIEFAAMHGPRPPDLSPSHIGSTLSRRHGPLAHRTSIAQRLNSGPRP